MIKKKNFFTGSVFQFYVPEIKKYAFCKYFDFTHLSKFHGLLAQVFDHFSDKEVNALDDLKQADWLFGARSMHRWPNLRKVSGWKSLGLLTGPSDEIVPDFKDVQSGLVDLPDESTQDRWYPIHNVSARGSYCPHEAVKHLERIFLTVDLNLSWRTGMEYCRINNLNIEQFYDLNDEGIRIMYHQMINIPLYRDIPKDIRGKALVGNSAR